MRKVLVALTLICAIALACLVLLGCGTVTKSGGGGGGGVPVVIWVATTGSDEAPDGDGSRDKPYRTIWKGLSEAASGQTVGMFSGTYELTSTVTWPARSHITLRGESRDATIIDGMNTMRAFNFSGIDPSPVSLTIEGLTMFNCAYIPEGGAVNFNIPDRSEERRAGKV